MNYSNFVSKTVKKMFYIKILSDPSFICGANYYKVSLTIHLIYLIIYDV